MIEVVALITADGQSVLAWSLPEGRTSGSVPDTMGLLDLLIRHRPAMAGSAHSHPGCGIPAPSWTDLTSYAAWEKYFGRRFRHWIATEDRLVVVTWQGPDRYDYGREIIDKDKEPGWVAELRRRSDSPEAFPCDPAVDVDEWKRRNAAGGA
jgi:hypothetical protein